ncbi:MAG: coniferyl aldehyde dehydrogenase, partial [Pseudomonadota bacterium]
MDGSSPPDLVARFNAIRAASRSDPFPGLRSRIDRIRRIEAMTIGAEKRLIEAISDDFSGRSRVETKLSETMTTLSAARHTAKHLKKWMRVR